MSSWRHPKKYMLIWSKSGGRCYYCGLFMQKRRDNTTRSFTVEHLRPKSRGGTPDLDNLVGVHQICNSFRANVPTDLLPDNFRKMCRRIVRENKRTNLPLKEIVRTLEIS